MFTGGSMTPDGFVVNATYGLRLEKERDVLFRIHGLLIAILVVTVGLGCEAPT
jgi:hypothetical protein